MSSRTTRSLDAMSGNNKLSPAGCLGVGLAILAFIVVVFAITSFIFMVLFNIVSPIFNGPTIDFVQAAAIWFLVCMVGSAFKRAT